MTIEDIDRVAQIEAQCFSMPWSRDAFASEMKNERAHYLVVQQDNRVVGFIGMHKILDEGYITNVAVNEQYRGRGIGAALINALLQRAGDLSLVTLEVRKSNHVAIALYEKMGFSVRGTRKDFYQSPIEDGLIMTFWREQDANL